MTWTDRTGRPVSSKFRDIPRGPWVVSEDRTKAPLPGDLEVTSRDIVRHEGAER